MATPEFPEAPMAPNAGPGPDHTDVLGRRFLAAILDALPLIVVFIVVAVLFGDTSTDEDGASANVEGWPTALIGLASLLYYYAFESTWGTSPGKRLLGLKVVDEHGAKPANGKIAIRTLGRIVDGLCCYIPGLIALLATAPRRQRLGDLAAKTYVVKA